MEQGLIYVVGGVNGDGHTRLDAGGYDGTRLGGMEWSVVLLRRWRFHGTDWRKFLQQLANISAVNGDSVPTLTAF